MGSDLSGITYSDGVTPPVTITKLDRLGRPKKITDAGGTCTLTYHATVPALVSEAYDSAHAALPGITVTSTLESATGRRTSLTVSGAGTTHSVGFTPDGQGRLETVTNASGGFSHTYEYHPGTALVASITHQQGGNTFATQTTHTDFAGQVTGIETKSADNTPLVRHGYQYNPAGRRTRATREDGTYWEFGYNPRGEVTSGKKHITDQLYLAGQQFEYDYDDIGNRKTAKSGGNATGASLRTITYGTANAAANAVNQYETITHPGSYDILGRAPAAATVSVEADSVPVTPVTRQGTPAERFHVAPTAVNTAGPAWQELQISGGGTPKTGRHFIPAATTTLDYDPDGNLEFDGRWDYTWDADNRLVRMTTAQAATDVGVPYRELRFTYDWQGRRIRKQVLGSNESQISDHRFAYDGWNLLAEYTASGSTLTLLRSYVWGLDLSGTEQGAGGVGGLLSVKHSGSEYASCYDGTGNVVAWLDGTANVVCRQEFDPFGNRIIHEGSLNLPIGFSTKYRDEETGLLYYGLRYLHTLLGRWPSRDPVAERGGLNLYGFVGNGGPNLIDNIGAQPQPVTVVGSLGGTSPSDKPFTWDQTSTYTGLEFTPDARAKFSINFVISQTGCMIDVVAQADFKTSAYPEKVIEKGLSGYQRTTEAELADAIAKFNEGIRNRWNNKFLVCCESLSGIVKGTSRNVTVSTKDKCCCDLKFSVEQNKDGPRVGVFKSDKLWANEANWHYNINPQGVAAHEFGHLLGNIDENGGAHGARIVGSPNTAYGHPVPQNPGSNIMSDSNGPVLERHLWRVMEEITGATNTKGCKLKKKE